MNCFQFGSTSSAQTLPTLIATNIHKRVLFIILASIISHVVNPLTNIKSPGPNLTLYRGKEGQKEELNIFVLSVQKICVITKELFNVMNAIVGLILLVMRYPS